ncbi:Arm DNA-binding domain-containing protein [Burkholderia sp. WSM2230]|uniref:Arm DNA-binding domain-containing protein n=1 Tax=Burkholderia sp. WSM2230 TaxID=944435 RepID=UPI000A00E9EC
MPKPQNSSTYMTFDAFQGLRLEATASRRSWTYRFKSPVDGRMRQRKLGEWPAMSYASAIAKWQDIRARRDAGEDPALTRRASNRHEVALTRESYTVQELCEDFLTGHIERHRDSVGAARSRRRLTTRIAPIARLPAETDASVDVLLHPFVS